MPYSYHFIYIVFVGPCILLFLGVPLPLGPHEGIDVRLCCSAGDILMIHNCSGVKNWEMIVYVHLCCGAGDILLINQIIFQNWKIFCVHPWGILCTVFFYSGRCPKMFFVQFHILCTGWTLHDMGAVRRSRSQIYELMSLLCLARLLKPASR